MKIQTMLSGMCTALALILATAWAGPAAAQFGPPMTPQIAKEMAAKPFTPPRIAADQIEKLAKQPDFQGDWGSTGPGGPGGGGLGVVFDPYNAYVPFQIPAGAQAFGPLPGTYMTKIPYNAEWQAKYKQIIADQIAGKSRDTYALCKPYGMPRFIGGAAVGFDIIQNANVISMQNWYDNEQRRIFLDGRPHPTTDPMGGENPRTYTGHSVGHWEGDVLVVDTANMVAGVYDDTEAPYSDQVHMVERIHLLDANTLEDAMTIDDPVAFTGPWTVSRYFKRRAPQVGSPTAQAATPTLFHNLADRVCPETIDMSQGFQSLILPQEIEAREKKKADAQNKTGK